MPASKPAIKEVVQVGTLMPGDVIWSQSWLCPDGKALTVAAIDHYDGDLLEDGSYEPETRIEFVEGGTLVAHSGQREPVVRHYWETA